MPANGSQLAGRRRSEARAGKTSYTCDTMQSKVENLCKNMAQATIINAIIINANLGCRPRLAWRIHSSQPGMAIDRCWDIISSIWCWTLPKASRLVTRSSVWIWHKKNARQCTITVLVVQSQAERNDTAMSMSGIPNHGCRLYHSMEIAGR